MQISATFSKKKITYNKDIDYHRIEVRMETKEMEELVLLAKQRDSKAFARLYEEIYTDLYRYAYYTLKNPHDAEDVVSEAVADAFYEIHGLQKPNAFKSWMFAILSAKCKRKLKSYVDKTVPLDENFNDTWQYVDSADLEERHDVRKALLKLSDRERMILNLSVVAGFTSAEIGKQLHINHNTVRSIQSRALAKLKDFLEE